MCSFFSNFTNILLMWHRSGYKKCHWMIKIVICQHFCNWHHLKSVTSLNSKSPRLFKATPQYLLCLTSNPLNDLDFLIWFMSDRSNCHRIIYYLTAYILQSELCLNAIRSDDRLTINRSLATREHGLAFHLHPQAMNKLICKQRGHILTCKEVIAKLKVPPFLYT